MMADAAYSQEVAARGGARQQALLCVLAFQPFCLCFPEFQEEGWSQEILHVFIGGRPGSTLQMSS